VRITGNRVHDRAGTAIALRTAVRSFMVKENVVANIGAGIAVQGRGASERVAVDNNEVFDVVGARDGVGSAIGILLMRAASIAAVGNTVARVGLTQQDTLIRAGIVVLAADDIRVSGNAVDDIGPPDGFVGVALGIGVVGPFSAASVIDNSSRFSAQRVAPAQGGWRALLIQSATSGLVSFGKTAAVAVGTNAVVFTDGFAFAAPARSDHAGLTSNTLTGGGTLETCLVRVAGDVVAQGNQCLHDQAQEPAGIRLQGSAITAASNRVRGGKSMLVLQVPENRFSALGNLAAGGTHLNNPGGGLPAPWTPLNPTVS
jgi:hypothetical protein